MVKSRKDSRIEVWSADYINNRNDCRQEVDKDVDIVQIEHGVGDSNGNYMVEIVDKKNPEEEKKSNDLAFASGKLSAMTILVGRLKAECDNPNRDWLGNKTYTEILNYILEVNEEFKGDVDTATINALLKD
jgi:hypothetical protein